MSKFFIKMAAFIFMAGLVLTGCPNLTDNGGEDDPADKTGLEAVISTAEAAMTGVVTDTAAANVPLGTSWVTQAEKGALETALNAARGVKDSDSASQAQVNAALTTLDNAVKTFNLAKKSGTAAPVIKDALNAKITEAKIARDSVLRVENESAAAADAAQGASWAKPSQVNALDAAITAAENTRDIATGQTAIDTALDDLTAALASFKQAVTSNGAGTKSSGFSQGDFTALIEQAKAAGTGVSVSENGGNVPPTGTWVSQADLGALESAISAAESAALSDTAYLALLNALTDFGEAKKPGLTPDKSPLFTAVGNADEARRGVTVAAGAGEVSAGSAWVTQGQWDTLAGKYADAFAAASDAAATKNAVDAALSALNTAISAFNGAKAANGPGTKTKTLTITGLGTIYDNGDQVFIAFFTSKDGNLSQPETSSEAEVKGGSVTCELGDRTGSYYAAFTAEEIIIFISKQPINFSGGSLSRTYNDFELMSFSVKLGDMGVSESMTLDEILRYEMEVSYAEFKALMEAQMKEDLNPKLHSLVDFTFYKDNAFTQAFKGTDTVNAGTVIYTKHPMGGSSSDDPDRGEQIGEISGSVTLTNVPSGSQVYIDASAEGWNTSRSRITGLSGSGGTANWTIPLYENDVYNGGWDSITGTRPVSFRLIVRLSGSDNAFYIGLDKDLDMTSKAAINAGNIGTASLNSITLSGTISVNNAGSLVPVVYIDAIDARGRQIGGVNLNSPGAGASWSMPIPVQQPPAAVSFRVDGYNSPNGGDSVFYTYLSPEVTKSAGSQNISGIALNIGDVSAGRMSGTVHFTNPAPYRAYLSARYGSGNDQTEINGGSGSQVNISTGAWVIPKDDAFLAALESGPQTVTFQVYIQMAQNEDSFRVTEVKRTVSKDGLGSINLGAFVRLSGTINVTFDKRPVPTVDITAQSGGYDDSAYSKAVPKAGG